MSKKLPADFNPEQYAASYPDVGQSGLSPKEHYLRFGRLLGRDPKGKVAASKALEAGRNTSGPSVPTVVESELRVRETPGMRARPRDAIIDRPADFDPNAMLPAPAPLRAGTFNLEALVSSADERVERCAGVAQYARMFALAVPKGVPEKNELDLGASPFQMGETRIENAWFAEDCRLRLMVAGGADQNAVSRGSVIRAYQAEPSNSAQLRQAGEGIQLPAQGPAFLDIDLFHPLMPLLLELSDRDGLIETIAVLPFPSLLPGGMHGAELKALQTQSNPMDAFWSLSESLLRECLGGEDWPERSIRALAIHSDDGEGRPLSSSICEWLTAVFGLALLPSATGKFRDGLRLILPTDSVPTISALVSRRLDIGKVHRMTGPFLVADDSSLRPRWSVAPAVDQEPCSNLPVLERPGRKTNSARASKAIPIHLAIAMRRAEAPSIVRASPTARAAKPGDAVPLTIVLDVSEPDGIEGHLDRFGEVIGKSKCELIVRFRDCERLSEEMLGGISSRWRAVSHNTDLRDLAHDVRHSEMLTVSDRVALDRTVIEKLCVLLKRDDRAASVSCVLLGETIFKKETVRQPASGGLFPGGVSFASSPRLSFTEPDVLQALPNLTYPVAANTLHLTVWRTEALANLARPAGPISETAADISLGLDLMEAGYRNYCTTEVTAPLSGPYVRRDAIDPIGSAYLQPAAWENILNQVTVLRELF